jgi:outer membrane receptor protein involved in Fe transport
MRNLDAGASDERPMANQSPYIVNLNVGYDNPKIGTALTILYNAFGRRFYYNAVGASPDIYEMPRHLVDLTFSQKLIGGLTLKAAAKNILNSHFEADYYYTGTGQKITFKKYDIGRTISLGLNYKLE